jgi:2-hydroxychromene-2-carboxylate isomerase
VFKSAGNTMPAAVPAKAQHLVADLKRWRDHYRIEMRMPPDEVPFPINSLLPMRVATAADLKGKGPEFCNAAFGALWVEGKDVSTQPVLEQVLDRIGLAPKEILDFAQTQEVKDRLRKNTDEAVERGAFGAPSFFIGSELYWGNDRLHFVEAMLKSTST